MSSVNAVQDYANGNFLSNVVMSTAVGGVVGYGAKYNIPLTKREKKDINYRAVVNSARKDTNLNKANSFKVLKSRTPAQDEFIKVVDNKEPFKYPDLTMIAERLGGDTTPLGKKALEAIKQGGKDMKFDELADVIGKNSEDRALFTKAFDDKEAFAKMSSDDIIAKLGGKDAPVAKKMIAIMEQNKGKALTFDEAADAIGKSSEEVRELKRVADLPNAFASENINVIIRKLGGENSQNGKEFRQIIREVDKESSSASRHLLEAYHKHLKGKRYTAPLVIAGAAAGFAAAFIHNVFSHKTES